MSKDDVHDDFHDNVHENVHDDVYDDFRVPTWAYSKRSRF